MQTASLGLPLPAADERAVGGTDRSFQIAVGPVLRPDGYLLGFKYAIVISA